MIFWGEGLQDGQFLGSGYLRLISLKLHPRKLGDVFYPFYLMRVYESLAVSWEYCIRHLETFLTRRRLL